MDAERYRELLVRHALCELPEEEREELEREMAGRDEAARLEAERVRETVAALGLAAAPRRPPTELRDRILGALPPEEIRSTVAPSPPIAAGHPRGRLWPCVAVAATVATIGLGLYALGLRDDLRRARGELQTAAGRAAETEALRDSLASMVADVSSLVFSDAISLSGTSPGVAGRARVFADVDTGRTLLLVDDLPVLPPDQVYQLWALRDASRRMREPSAWSAKVRPGSSWVERRT